MFAATLVLVFLLAGCASGSGARRESAAAIRRRPGSVEATQGHPITPRTRMRSGANHTGSQEDKGPGPGDVNAAEFGGSPPFAPVDTKPWATRRAQAKEETKTKDKSKNEPKSDGPNNEKSMPHKKKLPAGDEEDCDSSLERHRTTAGPAPAPGPVARTSGK